MTQNQGFRYENKGVKALDVNMLFKYGLGTKYSITNASKEADGIHLDLNERELVQVGNTGRFYSNPTGNKSHMVIRDKYAFNYMLDGVEYSALESFVANAHGKELSQLPESMVAAAVKYGTSDIQSSWKNILKSMGVYHENEFRQAFALAYNALISKQNQEENTL